MPKTEPLRQGGGSYVGHRGQRRVDSKPPKARLARDQPPAFVLRYANVSCPSGKHKRSILTVRGHSVAAMFCAPCEQGWTEPTTHPALRDLPIDQPWRVLLSSLSGPES
jgi:hypothetical protein